LATSLCFKLKVIQTLIGPLALAAFIGDKIPKKAHKKTPLNVESRWTIFKIELY